MASYNRVSLTSVRARLTDRVGANSTFWGDAEKNDAFNEALCVWQAMTGDFTRAFTAVAIPSDAFFEDTAFDPSLLFGGDRAFFLVPKQISSVQRVLYAGAPLQLVSVFELDNGFPSWQYTLGTPLYWTPVGLNVVAVYPAPTSGTLTFEGLIEGVRLASDGDFVMLGDEELTRLLDYARFYAAFKEGTREFGAASSALKKLIEAASLRNARLKTTNTYRRAMGVAKDELQVPPRDSEGEAGVRA